MTAPNIITDIFSAPVVALHSSASSGAQWKQLAAELDGRFTVSAIDLPGYGSRMADYGAPGIDGVADDIIGYLTGFGQAVHLVGHSFGASVALKVALMRPDLVKSLTLYEPVAFHLLENGDAEDRDQFAQVRRISTELSDSAAGGAIDCGLRAVVDFWSGHGTFDRSSEERRRKLSEMVPAVLQDFSRCFSEHWTLEDLSALTMPVLVLTGMDSPEIAQNVATKVANAVPQARLAILPGAGHMTPVHEPEWVNPRIYEHIVHAERPVANCFWPKMAA